MTWLNIAYFGLGLWIGSTLKKTFHDLSRLYDTFQKQDCINTILPINIESYVSQKVINTLEMCKFLIEYKYTQFIQFMNQNCVKHGDRYHIKCVINNKLYIFILRPERGPEDNCYWLDEKGIDRTEHVKAYLRGINTIVNYLSPEHFDCKELSKYVEDHKIHTLHALKKKE
jgi:hypothetical protein